MTSKQILGVLLGVVGALVLVIGGLSAVLLYSGGENEPAETDRWRTCNHGPPPRY
jgi:hypothetical protein